jgi:hypothetical protein
MDLQRGATLVMIPAEELELIKTKQQEILDKLDGLKATPATSHYIPINHITAIEFMEAVRIGRSKFDELVANNKIISIKKKRKIYVPVTEIERYFKDPSIQ